MRINNIFDYLQKLSFRKIITTILWMVTMMWLLILVILFVLWASVIKDSTPLGQWEYGYSQTLQNYLVDKKHTKEIQSQIKDKDIETIDVTKSVRENQEAIPDVKTLKDLIQYQEANLKYDLTGPKAPENNKITIENKRIIVWELTKWPTIPTDKAEYAENVLAAMALIFVVILSGTIFTTVLFAVKKNDKKWGNHG